MSEHRDRLEWLFGKPTEAEVKLAAMQLFGFGSALIFLNLGGWYIHVVTLRLIAQQHMNFVPVSWARDTIIAAVVLVAIGGALGGFVGMRIDRRASTRAKLAMVRCLDMGSLIFFVGMAAHFLHQSARNGLRTFNLSMAGFLLVAALWSFRPFRRRLSLVLHGGPPV